MTKKRIFFTELLCPGLEAAFDLMHKLSNKYTFQYPQSSIISPLTNFGQIQHFLSDAFWGKHFNINRNLLRYFQNLNLKEQSVVKIHIICPIIKMPVAPIFQSKKPVDRNCCLFVDCCSSNMDKYCPNDTLLQPLSLIASPHTDQSF